MGNNNFVTIKTPLIFGLFNSSTIFISSINIDHNRTFLQIWQKIRTKKKYQTQKALLLIKTFLLPAAVPSSLTLTMFGFDYNFVCLFCWFYFNLWRNRGESLDRKVRLDYIKVTFTFQFHKGLNFCTDSPHLHFKHLVLCKMHILSEFFSHNSFT